MFYSEECRNSMYCDKEPKAEGSVFVENIERAPYIWLRDSALLLPKAAKNFTFLNHKIFYHE